MKRILSTVLVILSCLYTSLANATLTTNSALGEVKIDGFLSVGTAWSDVNFLASGVEPVYISNIRKKPSFEEDSNVGVQITKQIHEDVSITVQFLAEADNQWEVETAWAFLKWEPGDHWQLRAGRVRTNPYMLSDYVNVGYAYPWVRPPEEVYSMIPAIYSNSTGADVRYRHALWNRDLTITGFYGVVSTELTFPIGPSQSIFDDVRLRLRDLYSFNLRYGDEVFSIRAGIEITRVTFDPNAGTVMGELNDFLNELVSFGLISPDYINYFSLYNKRTSFMGLGYQFDWNNIVSMGELVKRKSTSPIEATAIGWYLMGGYRVKQLLPHITFARERLVDNNVRRFNNIINQDFMAFTGSPIPLDQVAQSLIATSEYYNGGAGAQSSVTLGLRWDVIDGVALKAEYKHVHPDLMSPGLFDFNPLKSVNIYSLALDAVM